MYYKDFMGEIMPNNVAGKRMTKLPFRDWQPLLKAVDYQLTKKNTMKFFVHSGLNGWETYVQFKEWNEQVDDTTLNANEAARLLFWGGNLRLHCTCPSFSYWGFQYILTQLDAAIVPEDRFPHIRNPELKGIVCKHLNKTLKVLPFHMGDMAKEIKAQRLKVQTAPAPAVVPQPGKAPLVA
jgi:hypothetical protein